MVDQADIQECVKEYTEEGSKLPSDEIKSVCIDTLLDKEFGPALIGGPENISPVKLDQALTENGLKDEFNQCIQEQRDLTESIKTEMEKVGMEMGLTDKGYESIATKICAEETLGETFPMHTIRE